MTPFRDNAHLNAAQLNFNRELSQCRVRVENSYALAKGKWRRLKFMHAQRQDIVVDHITASFMLHNFVILHGEPLIDVSVFTASAVEATATLFSHNSAIRVHT